MHAAATALHQELIATLELPPAAARLLPKAAKALLPNDVTAALDKLATASDTKAVERVVRRLKVWRAARGDPRCRLGLSHPRLVPRPPQVGTASPDSALELLDRVQRAAEVWRIKSRATGAAAPGGSTDAESAARLLQTQEGSSPDPSPAARRGGWASMLKMGGAPRSRAVRLQARCFAARQLCVEIRRAQPDLGTTSCEASKVSANGQAQR